MIPNRPLFLSAAIFNWVVGLGMLLAYRPLFEMIGAAPIPEDPFLVQQFAGLVLIFGLGYFWASRDFARNIPVVKLGMLGKLSVFTLALIHVVLGAVTWQFLALASVDLVYALLFVAALRAHKS